MLSFLFRGLTAQPTRGVALFDALTAEARRPHWFVEGQVPDTFDGRFAVLASVTALALVQLEREGDAGNAASVALSERFIHVMESEHRELGLGDPTLGKTVRKLVAMLGRRVELWRDAERGGMEATRASLYKGDVDETALEHSTEALRVLARRLNETPLADLKRGRIA